MDFNFIKDKNEFEFKTKHTLEKRTEESKKILNKYADRIPIICEVFPKKGSFALDKSKYLVPLDLTLGQFVYVVRKRIKIPPEKAIFLFINGLLPATSTVMSSLYKDNKNEDGFLYIGVREEATFG